MPNLPEARFCRGCGVLLTAPLTEGSIQLAGPDGAGPTDPVATTYPPHSDVAAQAWRDVRGVAWSFLILVGLGVGLFVAEQVGAPGTVVDLVLTSVVALLALALAVRAWRQIVPSLITTGGVRGLLVAAGAFLALLAFGKVYFGVCDWLGFPTVRYTDDHVAAGWPAWVSYLLISVAPAVTEELLFRGYVMTRLSRALTANEALLVQAALFSVLHFSPVIFPSHFVIGLALGLVRRHTGSLYPGMAVHAFWNAKVVWLELGE